MEPEYAVDGVWQDVGVDGHENPKRFPGMGFLPLLVHRGKHHAVFGR